MILVVSDKEKDTSSTSVMETSRLTSPLLQFRASSVVQKVGSCVCQCVFVCQSVRVCVSECTCVSAYVSDNVFVFVCVHTCT